jgi:hypothetical protein
MQNSLARCQREHSPPGAVTSQPECSQILREAGLADAMKILAELPDGKELSKFLPVFPSPIYTRYVMLR